MRAAHTRLLVCVAATGAACLLALAGCEAVLGVGSLQERSAADDGGPVSTMDSGFDGGSDSAPDAGSGDDAPCTIPEDAACAVDPQCGCPSSEKCDIGNSVPASCMSFGTTPVGAVCNNGDTDCEPGATCLGGVCHPFCTTPSAPCPAIPGGPPVGECYENNGNTVQGFICALPCALAPNSCKNETGCVTIELVDGGLFSDCELPGSGAAGAPCATDRDCQKGFGCGISICYQWCVLGGTTNPCVAGTCQAPVVATINGIQYAFCH